MIRVSGHLPRPELFDIADRLGLLVWQDLPLIGGYSSKTRRAVKTVIREAVDAVGHHPSVIAWGGHCRPNGEAIARPGEGSVADPALQIVRHLLPSWNRSFLDLIVGRELEAADPSRPIVARSGHLASPLDNAPSDSRLWLGWRMGEAADAADVYHRWPRLAQFPAGIGAQTVTLPKAADRRWADWSDTDWTTAEFVSLTRYTNPGAHDDFSSWAEATEVYQADLVRRHIETVRLRKYQPSGGYCITALADAEPWGGYGLVRFDRSVKSSLYAVTLANRTVMAVIDNPPMTVAAAERLTLHVKAINDLYYGLEPATVTALATDIRGATLAEGHWQTALPADSATAVGSLQLVTPSATLAVRS